MTNQPVDQLGQDLNLQLDSYSTLVRTNAKATASRPRRGPWNAYAAALGSGLALTTAAEAGIIYSGPQDLTISVNNQGTVSSRKKATIAMTAGKFGRFPMQLEFFKTPGFRFGGAFLSGGQSHGHAVVFNRITYYAPGTHLGLKRFAPGALISFGAGSLTFGGLMLYGHSNFGRKHGTFPKSVAGLAGVVWSTTHSKIHFGWIRLEWQDTTGAGFPNKMTAIDWAYNDVAGASIKAGDKGSPSAVPEPASLALALMAAGALGLAAWRRRQARNDLNPALSS